MANRAVLVVSFVLYFVLVVAGRPAIDMDLIRAINGKGTWVAGVNQIFINRTTGDVKRLLGWKGINAERKALPRFAFRPDMKIPSSFTSATNWPKCHTIGSIYNQAECGSCWAFGGVEAASDRFCIASNATFNQVLSFAEVTECTSGGCGGGSSEDTWYFIQNTGLVTARCYPYYIPTCPPAQQPCLNFVDTPECWSNRTCVNGAPWKKHFISQYYSLNSMQDAQADMMQHGPVEACFDVYEDFLHYKSGVYQHISGSYLGGHCVKIQGWGVENGKPYWLVNNSWTTYWGDKGQFKILRGNDECGIEDDLVAGTPII